MSRARIPPWTAGWRVLTRPPSISGAFVIAETSLREIFSKENKKSESHIEEIDSLDGEASFPNHLGCTARREDADIVLGKTLCKVEQTSLVIDRQDSCLAVSKSKSLRSLQSLWLQCMEYFTHDMTRYLQSPGNNTKERDRDVNRNKPTRLLRYHDVANITLG